MSYEGYEQCICKNGHYFERDAYQDDRPCPDCDEEAAWFNGVDQTNGEDAGFIPIEALDPFVITGIQQEKCNLGHYHTIANPVYRVPTREETEPLRTCGNGRIT